MKILETLPEIINVRSTCRRTSSKNRLKYKNSGKTFIKVDGEECSVRLFPTQDRTVELY